MIKAIIFILQIILFNGTGKVEGLDAVIKNSYPWYDKVEYEVVRPKNFESISVDKNYSINDSDNYLNVPAVVKYKNGSSKRTMITVEVKLYRTVYVALKNIKRYEELSESDFMKVQKEIKSRGKTPYNARRIKGVRARTLIKKGEILYSEDVENIPVIKVGERLNGKFINGNVMIEMEVIAKQEGYYEDIIRVAKGNRLYTAKVLDANNVLIMERK